MAPRGNSFLLSGAGNGSAHGNPLRAATALYFGRLRRTKYYADRENNFEPASAGLQKGESVKGPGLTTFGLSSGLI